MSIITWIKNKLSDGTMTVNTSDSAEFWGLASSIYVRELAFQSAVNLISKAVSKCEFKTFQDKVEIKGDEYYLWNIEPNRNQNSSVFLNKLIAKLMTDNEVLVIETTGGKLLIADTYQKTTYALYDYKFTNVSVDEFVFLSPFYMKDVLFFQLNSKDVRGLVNGLHESYGKLAEYAQKAYQKSRGQKGILEISSGAAGSKDFEKNLEKMMNERFKTYFGADSAVMPITEGYKYTEQDRKTYNSDSTRDIRAQIDDVFVFTGRAFGIQPALLLGEIADTSKSTDALLTFCIDPLTDMIQEEINRKRYGRINYLAGTFLKIETKAIKHIDLLSVSTAIDKLISSGAWCINDIRELVGDEPINEGWAKQHWMTKNYGTVADIMNAMNGGETNSTV